MLLLIDNYDSFTYNLVHYFRELGKAVRVVLNDKITLDEIESLRPSHIVISPGPGRPQEAGVTLSAIQYFKDKIPILGVCLGHQAIALALGGKISFANEVMHGKTSLVAHEGQNIFKKLPTPLRVMRYHSLVIDPENVPSELRITAWTDSSPGNLKEIMGIQHLKFPIYGVQFHPESIATESGHQMLQNFLDN